MPLVDVDDPAVWASLFHSGWFDCGYDRIAKRDFLGDDGLRLRTILNIQKIERVVLIGAGFGWVAEDWIADGYNVVACDISGWVQQHKNDISLAGSPQASIPILNEDGRTNNSRRAIKTAFGGPNTTVDWAITEDLVGYLSDAECLQYAPLLRSLATKIAHWISVGVRKLDNPGEWAGDPRLNWKTLEDWKALLTPDLVVDKAATRVL